MGRFMIDCPPVVISYEGREIAVAVARNPRAKRVRLKIDRKTRRAELILPKRASLNAAAAFAASKAAWIAEQLKKLPEKRVFCDGLSLTFLGQEVVIHHSPMAKRGVWLDGGVVWVSGRAEHLARRTRDFFKSEFAVYALKRARETAMKTGGKVVGLIVRDTTSRWGSCSKDGRLNLSWRLGLAPLFVADYVIAHEVAHLCQMNHSAAFWAVVADLCPDFKKAEAWLKKNAAVLYSYDIA